MKRSVPALIMAAAMVSASGQGRAHVITPSTWALVMGKSNFGGGPAWKSDVYTVAMDTEQWLKFSEVRVDAEGKRTKFSWSGPQDGSLRPLLGLPGAQAGFNMATDGSHMALPGGAVIDCVQVFSEDRNGMTKACESKTPDGKVTHQTLVYERTR